MIWLIGGLIALGMREKEVEISGSCEYSELQLVIYWPVYIGSSFMDMYFKLQYKRDGYSTSVKRVLKLKNRRRKS